MYSLKFRDVISGDGITTPLDKTVTVSADGLDQRDFSLPVGADQQVTVAFTTTAVVGYFIVADANVLLETNTITGAGGDIINLVANVPITWYTGCGYIKHFTTNVTTIYLTNAGTAPAHVQIVILKDTTV